jgi:hypothetical protein
VSGWRRELGGQYGRNGVKPWIEVAVFQGEMRETEFKVHRHDQGVW